MKKDNPPIKLVFGYKGKEYPMEKRGEITFVNWDKEMDEWSWFWWEDGNGSCDCNRSITIREEYPDFEKLKCGGEIELLDWEVLSH